MPKAVLLMMVTATLVAACGGGNERSGELASDSAGNTTSDGAGPVDLSNESGASGQFRRIATFAVCEQVEPTCDTDEETVAEIVAASTDGNTLIYTDGGNGRLGLVDISNPASPQPAGFIAVGGEPTSVAVTGQTFLTAVNLSPDFINPAGELVAVDSTTRQVTARLDLGGQPDSIAVSPDSRYAAVVIENERDEDLGDGSPPQQPGGALVIVDLAGEPTAWSTRTVSLSGLANKFPSDPEPEYVSINANNEAVVTLQENNHLVIVDLVSGDVIEHFNAGSVDLTNIDATEEEPALISLTESLANVPREADAVTWLNDETFATADEGDLDGGGRGFTIYRKDGSILYTAGNTVDTLAAKLGHYPDGRSENKGSEPEGIASAAFRGRPYLFVAAERANLLGVYDVTDVANPVLAGVLPTGVGPEGVLPIADRQLLVVASEVDSRDDKIRSSLMIYRYEQSGGAAFYPMIEAATDDNGRPISWGALSGLAINPGKSDEVFTVSDSFYQRSSFYRVNVSAQPAQINEKIELTDPLGLVSPDQRNPDGTVNLDLEGIAVSANGNVWLVSEGAGTVGDPDRPVETSNWLIQANADGTIQQTFGLPDEVNSIQRRFGFEGVADAGDSLVVAFQRAWGDEDHPRLGIFDKASCTWRFVFYPLESAASANGGWVGLSDITPVGNKRFWVLERDNQGGPDAAIKRIYEINLDGAASGSVVQKTLVNDLMDELGAQNGLTPEKLEGLAILADGTTLVVNDNDGVDDNSGETVLLRVAP